MRYEEPETVEEAVSLLTATPGGRCLAGGAVVVALMNAGAIAPDLLVSLRRLAGLAGISETSDGVRIGAMTSHATVAADARLAGAMAVVRSAASQIAHPPVRNMATLGGSVCLADPDSDLPGALIAAAAQAEITGSTGPRTIPIEQVFVGRYQTSLAPGEILTGVSIPGGPAGAAGVHVKFSRVDGDYATVSISLVLAMNGATCSHARVAVGSCGPTPIHVDAADARLIGSTLGDGDIAAAAAILVAAANPIDDVRGSAEYRRMLIPRLLGRAISRAREQAHA
ncbi:MAG TPA: xanthine dehydrogenase family protein subunit M [Haliangium sp.]|nr:xanthine dehydrogenase family protein subunit M [Haliangium sp.]